MNKEILLKMAEMIIQENIKVVKEEFQLSVEEVIEIIGDYHWLK